MKVFYTSFLIFIFGSFFKHWNYIKPSATVVLSDPCLGASGSKSYSHPFKRNTCTLFQLLLNYTYDCHSTQLLALRSLTFRVFPNPSECFTHYQNNDFNSTTRQECMKPHENDKCFGYDIPITDDQKQKYIIHNDSKCPVTIKDDIAKTCIGRQGGQTSRCKFSIRPDFFIKTHFQNQLNFVSFDLDCIDKSTIYDISSSTNAVSGRSVSLYHDVREHPAPNTRCCRVNSASCYDNVAIKVISNGASCDLNVNNGNHLKCGSANNYNDLTIGTGKYFYDINITVSNDSTTPILWIEATSTANSILTANCSTNYFTTPPPQCTTTPTTTTSTTTPTTTTSTKTTTTAAKKKDPGTSSISAPASSFEQQKNKGSFGPGAIAGIIIGVLAAGVVAGVGVFYYKKKNKVGTDLPTKSSEQDDDPDVFQLDTVRTPKVQVVPCIGYQLIKLRQSLEKTWTLTSMAEDSLMMKRQYVPSSQTAGSVDHGEQFSVVSYNILAQCHTWKNDFSYTKVEYTKADYRHGVLMDELVFLDGDIVCLQEVNPAYYKTKLRPAMECLGYTAAGIKRRFREFDEGCATFFKTRRFSLVGCTAVSLTDLVYKEIDQIKSVSDEIKTSAKTLMDRNDVMLVTQLQLKCSEQTITVGNIHVWWDKLKYPDVKSFQVAVATKEVIAKAKSIGSCMLLCGDFNSTPDCPPYELVTTGSLSPSTVHNLERIKSLETSNGPESLVTYFQDCLTLPNNGLTSAYHQVLGHEPDLTEDEVRETLDYIFFDRSKLYVAGVLKTVDGSVIKKRGGILEHDLPSDHLSVKAVFECKLPAGNTM